MSCRYGTYTCKINKNNKPLNTPLASFRIILPHYVWYFRMANKEEEEEEDYFLFAGIYIIAKTKLKVPKSSVFLDSQ